MLEPLRGLDMAIAVAVGREVAMTEDDGTGEETVEVGE